MYDLARLFVFVSCLSFLLGSGFLSAAEDAPRRNVVIFVVDDQGLQAGCYGNPVIKTPNLDRLAEEGVRFTNAVCTTASCSASRSVILTGLYNHSTGHYGHAHGYNHFSTYESVTTLPVMLSRAGYRTCSVGKYHVAPEAIYHFDAYRNQGSQGNRNAVRMANNALEWIAEDDEKPFFLYFCTSDPHRGGGPDGFSNYNADPEYYPGVTPVRYRPEDVIVPPWLPDTQACREELAEYYQAISRLDQGLGVLLDGLEEQGVRDETLIMFLSDNGPPFPGAKTTMYQPGMNLPLIVSAPDQKTKGGTNAARVSWADLTPTVLDFCGVQPQGPPVRPRENKGAGPPEAQGKPLRFGGTSFLDVVNDPSLAGSSEEFASHTFHEITMYYPMRVYFDGHYKYIFNIAHQLPYPFASDLHRSPTWQDILKTNADYYGNRRVHDYLYRPRHELYDLKADPHELNNLAERPEHQQRLQTMQERLKAWQAETRDPWISKWEYE